MFLFFCFRKCCSPGRTKNVYQNKSKKKTTKHFEIKNWSNYVAQLGPAYNFNFMFTVLSATNANFIETQIRKTLFVNTIVQIVLVKCPFFFRIFHFGGSWNVLILRDVLIGSPKSKTNKNIKNKTKNEISKQNTKKQQQENKMQNQNVYNIVIPNKTQQTEKKKKKQKQKNILKKNKQNKNKKQNPETDMRNKKQGRKGQKTGKKGENEKGGGQKRAKEKQRETQTNKQKCPF